METTVQTMEQKLIKIDNLEISVHQNQDKGKPVLFIPGAGMCGEVYSRQFEAEEASDFRYIAIDMPGHGHSSAPEDPEAIYTPKGIQHIIQEVAKELKADNPVLVGHSIGSQLAVELTTQMDTKGILLTGALIFKKPGNPQEAIYSQKALEKLMHGKIDHKTALEVGNNILHPDRPAHEYIVKCLKNTDGNFYRSLNKILSEDMFEDQAAILKNYKKPVAIVQGTQDPVASNEYLEKLDIPTLWEEKIHYIPDTGHLPFWEIPESFNSLLKRFLRSLEN